MSFKKFGENDVIVNTMKAYPACKFFVFDGKIYYNEAPPPSGAFSDRVYNVPPGHISLYEYNIDRSSSVGNVSTTIAEAEESTYGAATAVDAIDTTGVAAAGVDTLFTFTIPSAAGGEGGATTIALDASATTVPTAGANKIGIGFSDKNNAQIAALIIKAINGTAATNIVFASSGNGQSDYDSGITAAEGSSNTQITLTIAAAGLAGNLASALADVSGTDVIDVTDFTGGTVAGWHGPRSAGSTAFSGPGSSLFIYPYVTVGADGEHFKSISAESFTTDYDYGDPVTSSYPMSASIVREFMSSSDAGLAGSSGAGKLVVRTTASLVDAPGDGDVDTFASTYYISPEFRHFYALKNRLNFYGIRSEHYKVESLYGNKMSQSINLISIPSIFFGSGIKPGSLSLKWYLTGSLAGELRDTKQNGELIEVTGSSTGSVAGVVLYEEGFILLTGSWDLNAEKTEAGDPAVTIGLISSSAPQVPKPPQWIYFGAGANDNVNQTTTASSSFNSASFDLSFKGTTETQVLTMFAHARRGQVNFSNNPTFIAYSQSQLDTTSSQVYQENASRTIYNTVSSSYLDYGAPFKRQVYISRVAIYDKNKNLVGVATLANPILKKEDEDLSFKLKLDI